MGQPIELVEQIELAVRTAKHRYFYILIKRDILTQSIKICILFHELSQESGHDLIFMNINESNISGGSRDGISCSEKA